MFNIYDMRSKKEESMSSEEFRNFIIQKTESRLEYGRPVIPERTGYRGSKINALKENFCVYENVFLVTAISRVNNNVNTRYMILIDETNKKVNCQGIEKIVNKNIPIYRIRSNNINQNQQISFLSYWFRKTMGRAFSFIDLDYLIQKDNHIIIIEEKNSLYTKIGYGQLLSLKELANDIFSVPTTLLFIYIDNNIQYYICEQYDINNYKYNFISQYPGYRIKNENIHILNNNEELIDIIKNHYILLEV